MSYDEWRRKPEVILYIHFATCLERENNINKEKEQKTQETRGARVGLNNACLHALPLLLLLLLTTTTTGD